LHSALKFVTPDQRYKGEDTALLAKRHQVYLKAQSAHPERWSCDIKNWQPVKEAYLNPEKKEVEHEVNQAA
jgi:putative transposase